jgi:hypothetical protein
MRRLRPVALLLGLAALLAAPAPGTTALESVLPEVEAFEQALVDCTRAGGWVKVDGTCDHVDAAARVPARERLAGSVRISDDLSRPYARRLARAGRLSHELGGDIHQRFRRLGLPHGDVGENIGYAGGLEPREAVLRIHRLFQAEWSYRGPHWKNLTDRRFAKVGIGVWVRRDRTYLVLDFHS